MEKKIYITPLTEETLMQTMHCLMGSTTTPPDPHGGAPRRRMVGDIID